MDADTDYKSLHARAADLVKTNTVFAYAVAKELRKRLVGHESGIVKQELMERLAYSTYNSLIDIQSKSNDKNYNTRILCLISETAILAHDILTERISYAKPK